MKRLLLDHNVDPRIAHHLPGCEIRRAAQEGLTDVGNGDLIRAAQLLGFDALLTKDRNMEHQQSARPDIAVIVAMCGNPFTELLALAPCWVVQRRGGGRGGNPFTELLALAPAIADVIKDDLGRRFYNVGPASAGSD